MKSGSKIFKSFGPNGVVQETRGVFITEEDLARGGDAFRYFVRTNHLKARELDDAGYNVYKVMWLLLNAQRNSTAYEFHDRETIKIFG